ncbi:DUF4238 domain-containing protein [Ruminococcus sp.]|uniref:DUF4238 domain-containing protein n=1 Tax=Ruminococcus sp. TaxID=41978 RepID=UPI00258FB4A7|nr:DUF4238 domain-containing protein [Ruminococcus sp.]MCR5020127.1 DUF4238 domain-containing protein [Ruminococcus sp.]
MAQNKPTTDEHYIPQCYLKQFSSDGEHIYQYDALSGKQTPVPVPTKSVCYQKHLYEFRDSSGAFAYRNLIEKYFRTYEGEFATVFRSIQSKSSYEANYHTLSFLTTKEKARLVFFLSTMIVRDPDVLQAAQETALEFFGDQLTEISARNLALQTCLPIYKALDTEERNLLNPVMRFFDDMSFQIGVTDKDVLWTSDSPVVLFGNNQPVKLDEVVMPISPHIALYMKPYENTRKGCYNRLTELRPEDIKYVNRAVVMHCKRWIYSKAPLTDKQIKWIKRERG